MNKELMEKELMEKKIVETAEDGKLSCAEAFRLANELSCSPKDIGSICNEKDIKINKCQLGCF